MNIENKNTKLGIALIILGIILILAYFAFGGDETGSFGHFSQGILLGLSIGINLVGIILIVSGLS
ncbi:MAG: hypothetical protein Q4C64_06005 [Erysipelotrichia bacterium]|nr:hypothetical protein [Erysipelotrichia bacterium]